MKNTLLICLLLMGTMLSAFAQPGYEAQNLALDLKYKPGEVIVKFKDEIKINFSKSNDLVRTGLVQVDQAFEKWSVSSSEQLFRAARYERNAGTIRFPDGTEKPVPQFHNIFLMKYPEKFNAEQVAEELNKLEEVEYAEVNATAFIHGLIPVSEPVSADDLHPMKGQHEGGVVPNDPLYDEQWYLPEVKADLMWDTLTGDSTQVIAILDTGVDWLHPDLVNKIDINPNEILDGQDSDGNGYVDDIRGWDFVNNDNNPMDDNSHGTHCAGIAAAETDNGIGIAGVSWGAKIMPIKVFQSNGVGYVNQIAEGIWYAAQNGANIFSNSWGGYGESITIRLAFEFAYSKGPIIAAAGNSYYKIDHPTPPFPMTAHMFPASYNWVLGVEATEPSGWNAWFSNYDPTGPVIFDGRPYGSIFFNDMEFNYEVRAPGLSLLSTVPNGQYRYYSGTSMATPVVAGAVALMKNHQSDLSIEQIFAKLIQLNKLSMFQAGVLDIPNSILNEPLPDLYFVANVIDDSDSGGNNNGRVDAGEQVNMFVRVKNAGGLASGVYAKLRFREFEDQTTANIIKSTSQIGPISAYGQLLSSDSIIVDFNENLAHGRFVSFELLIWQEGLADTTIANLDIKVEKGIEIKGVYDDLHLTGDAYYLVTEPAVFNNLTIDPGVTLRFGNNMYIMIAESLTAIGKPDSMITFKGADDAFYRGIRMTVNTDSHFEYCIFEDGMPANDFWLLERPKKIYHSIFRNSLFGTRLFFPVRGGDYKYNVVTQNGYDAYDGGLITFWDIGDQPLNFKYNLIKANEEPLKGFVFMNTEYPVCMDSLINNTFIGKYAVATNSWNGWPLGVYKMNENYWGTTNINDIRSNILDFFEDPTLPVLEPDTILQLPPEECHGFVWKIELNGVNPQDGILDPFGGGLLRFDIHFNRPMDTSFTPFVTFGVRFPFTQNAVTENTSWSADSTVWTGYHNISLNTGDGINTIRVAHARDTDRFEIPIERDRFSFVIQAAGSQSIDFYATPGIGKVSLQWPKHEDEEVLGYNLYRYNLLDSLSTSDTLLINNALLTDTTFIDFSVIPDTSYFYMFTVTKTDLSESDYSKVVFAKPFSTANGDANGDMATNILDITTIVSFILGQNPQPFLFEAADLNADEIINLLDIILTANIILDNNKKSAIQSEPAYIGLQDNQVILKSDGTLSGLQFQLIGKRITDLTFHNLPKGFEFVKHVNGDTLSGLLFNFGNTTLSEGEIKLFEVSNSSGNLKWGNTFGGNHGGVYVPVYVVNNSQIVDGNFSFNVFPNPADNLITLDVGLPTLAQTQIIISDVFGRELYRYEPIHAEAGHFQLSINKNQLNINSGVVIFTIDVQPLNDSTIPFKKSVKLIIM